MKGVCINADGCGNLVEKKEYFLFENGPLGFYVSRFDKPGAHMGIYKQDRFQVVTEEKEGWPQEPAPFTHNLEVGRLYMAKLVWRKEAYQSKKLGAYYIRPKSARMANFYHDRELKTFGGCFPIHWFNQEDFTPIKENDPIEAAPDPDPIDDFYEPIQEFEQLTLF